MPVHETDRTDDFRRKSLETSSQVSALGQSYMPKDRTSGLLDDESHHVIEQSHDYHDQEYVAGHDNESEDRDLKGGRHPSADDVQIFEERSERRSEANQDLPLSEEQMNALTRDLREQPVTGMGNERQSEDLSTGEQALTDNLSTENQPLVEEQINALAQDLKKQMSILAHDVKEQMNAMARDLKEQPTIGSGNQKHSAALSSADQVQIDKLDMKTEKLGEEQMNALTRDLREQPVSGMENERQSEDISSGSQTQTDKIDTETITVHKSTDLGNATLRNYQGTTDNKEQRETKRGAADEPLRVLKLINIRCKECNENYQPCDLHDRSEDIKEPNATSSNQVEFPEFNDDDKVSLAAGIGSHSEEGKAEDIQPANDSGSNNGTELESVHKGTQTEQSTADSQMDKGERKPQTVEIEETRIERKSQPADERPAKTDNDVKQSGSPSAPRDQTTDVKKDLKVKSEKGEQHNAAAVETTKSDEISSSTSSDNNEELKEKSSSVSQQELKEGEKEAEESQSDDGSEKSDKCSFADDDPRVEHVDRNRETRPLAMTGEAFTAIGHKLKYEAKYLARRVKDTFKKKKHHEVEIWPDGVVMGEEPENQPEPTTFIKAAHDVVAKFNERAADDFEEKRKDSSSSEEMIREPAEKNASDKKKAEERCTEAVRASSPNESDRSSDAKQASETVAIESRSINIAKDPTRIAAESKKGDQDRSGQSVKARSDARRKDEQSDDTTKTAEDNKENKGITKQESSSRDVKETGDVNEKLKGKKAVAASKAEDNTKESPVKISEENLQRPANDDEETEPADRVSAQKIAIKNSEKEGDRMSNSAAKQPTEIKESERKEMNMEAENTERTSMKKEQPSMDSSPPTEDRRERVEEAASIQSTSANACDNSADLQQGKVAAVETTIIHITKIKILQ
uniref:Uncharacterized protein n=1 Tax=Plectus sambesii TaxID=2011161 RepID=A0A914W1D3_9BILA